jgi:ATP-dependent exoDNAse (exonuclease V) beta subunit
MHADQMRILDDLLWGKAGELAAAAAKIRALRVSPKDKGAFIENLLSLQNFLQESEDIEILAEKKRFTDFLDIIKTFAALRLPGRVTNPVLVAYKEGLCAVRDIISAGGLVSIIKTLEARDILKDIYDLLDKFERRIETEKRTAGVLTFADCAELAVKSLTGDKALRDFYKRKFTALMIDEFQDNNGIQKDLLYLLAEKEDRCCCGIPLAADLDPGKLFFVGDEKQSIYLFRGADVRVFKGLADELAGAGGEDIRLHTNYRSEPELITFFNTLFYKVMNDGESSEFDARFEALAACGQSESLGARAAVFFKPYIKEKEESSAESDDAEAWFLARKIQDWVETGSLAVRDKEKGVRPAGYGDFALLMRSTSNQIRYERIFRRFNIPYTTTGIRSLFLEAPVNDLYNLLQCVVYPEDRLAYAALLRSAFVHLSDDAALAILLAGLPLFESGETPLSGTDRKKFDLGRELYEKISGMADRVSVPALLSCLWRQGGYIYTVLANPSHHSYLELYEYLREFALKVTGETLAGFLDRLRPNLGHYEHTGLEIRRDEAEGVKIMTIHKSKGLEFPVVIVANSGNTGKTYGEGSAIFYPTARYGLSCGLGKTGGKYNYFYKLGKEEAEKAELAELRRLLYVACTRAESQLFISGCFTEKNRKKKTSLLKLVFDALGLDAGSVDAPPCEACKIEIIPDVKESDVYAPRSAAVSISLEEARKIYGLSPRRPPEKRIPRREFAATELQELLGPHPDFAAAADVCEPGDPELDRWFGRLCHKVIELSLPGGVSDAVIGNIRARGLLKADCPSPGKYETFLAEARTAAENFFASAFAKELFSAAGLFASTGKTAEPEVPFVLKLEAPNSGGGEPSGEGRIIVKGTMDLVIHLPEKTVIVDFKTDKQISPERHGIQLALYRRAAEEIWRQKAETFLYYLGSGKVVQSEEALPSITDTHPGVLSQNSIKNC